MKMITLAGVDPALRNMGLARVEYNLNDDTWRPCEIKLVQTESRKGKTVRQNSDDLRCATELSVGIAEWVTDTSLTFAEIPGGSQSARGSFSNGVSLGVLSSINSSEVYKGRLIQVQPSEVKLAAVGSKHATKQEMIDWAYESWPDLGWYMYRGKPSAKNEHMADALATIVAGIKTDEFVNITQTLKILQSGEVKS